MINMANSAPDTADRTSRSTVREYHRLGCFFRGPLIKETAKCCFYTRPTDGDTKVGKKKEGFHVEPCPKCRDYAAGEQQ